MFDKFGEFDSWEEINRAAAAQKAEGDTEAVYLLAKENGIDEEDAEDYLNGESEELATSLIAAFGKLKVEAGEMEPYEIMEDWLEYIRMRCMESQEMALAVRSKKKSLKGCMAALLCWSFKNAKPVDAEILSQAGVSGRVTLGIPGMGRARQIITDYYLGNCQEKKEQRDKEEKKNRREKKGKKGGRWKWRITRNFSRMGMCLLRPIFSAMMGVR